MKSIFSTRLKAERLEKKLTQQQLADLANDIFYGEKISRVSINRYENGVRIPDIDILIALSTTLEVDLDYLLGKTNSKHIELVTSQLNDFNQLLKNYMETDDKETNEMLTDILDMIHIVLLNRDKKELKLIYDLFDIPLTAYLDISHNRNLQHVDNGVDNLNSQEMSELKNLIINNFSKLLDKIDMNYNSTT